MPEVKAKAPVAKKKAEVIEREVVYPKYEVLICCLPVDGEEYDGPITVAMAKKLLGWETEGDYEKRMLAGDPTLKASKLKFGNEFLLKDAEGNKVRCWNNSTNRPFDESHSRKIGQDILSQNWMMNLENIIISRTGLVTSGQHRLIGLVLAWEEWKKQPHWQEVWPEEPYIESTVAMGGSDDPKVLRTVDNVKPRTLSDVFYTSPLFANKNQQDRKEMSRMLDYAVDLLWKRLRATESGFIEYQTHSASLDFFERHKKLQACVKHLHDEDGSGEGRGISNLGLNTGHCSALCYLMGQSGTDPDRVDQYYTAGAERDEKALTWKNWDKALQFWTELGENKEDWAQTVRDALSALNDPDSGRGATAREMHSVIALAWAKYLLGEKFNHKHPEALHPEFVVNEATNKRRVVDEPTFGGIDRGTSDEGEEVETTPTPAEIKERATAIQTAARTAQAAKVAGKAPTVIGATPDKKVLPIPTKVGAPPKAPTGNGSTTPPAVPTNGKGKSPAPKPPAPPSGSQAPKKGPPSPPPAAPKKGPPKPAPKSGPSDAELAAIEANGDDGDTIDE